MVLLSGFKGIAALFFVGLYSVRQLFTESNAKNGLGTSSILLRQSHWLIKKAPVPCMIKTGLSISSKICGTRWVVWKAQNYEYPIHHLRQSKQIHNMVDMCGMWVEEWI